MTEQRSVGRSVIGMAEEGAEDRDGAERMLQENRNNWREKNENEPSAVPAPLMD